MAGAMSRLMKCLFLFPVWLFSAAFPVLCIAMPQTTLHDIRQLNNDDVAQKPFVRFEATVVFFDNRLHDLNLQDGDDGIFAHASSDFHLEPGDRVRVEGRLTPSFLPYLTVSHVKVLHHGPLPPALPVGFDDLVRTRVVSLHIKAQGRIRAADLVNSTEAPIGRLLLSMDGGYADLEVVSADLAAMRALLDAEVEVTGVAGRKFDTKMQQTGVRIRMPSLASIRVLRPAPADPWALPITALGSIITGYHVQDHSSRLRVRGVLTYYEPGVAAVLQNGKQSLWVQTASSDPLAIGDEADVIGFPLADEGRLTLIHAELRPTGAHQIVLPQHARWEQLAEWANNNTTGHGFDLVSIEARVISQARTDHEDRYVLDAGGSVFSAVLHRRASGASSAPMRRILHGSLVNVTGICWIDDGYPTNGQVPFDILLRSPEDLVLLAGPPLWSVPNLALALGIVFLFLVVLGVRTLIVERRAHRHSMATAEVERRRRHILEQINSMRPLADIVEETTQVVSLSLNNAPCWCSITGGATLGAKPEVEEGLRTVERLIPARTGGLLGSIYVALPLRAKSPAELEEALSLGAGLVAVAIETRRLYTDLVHRSEYDQLTGLYNRAVLDQKVEALMQTARDQGSIFALIYIDLDNFKQVNDNYGHRTGDLFLEEAAHRMKSQLRPCDLLARLGGDEFAALLTNVRNREEVEEVAARLERSLAEPFALGKLRLPGSASTGIALYPADANSEDTLLTHADAAMYAHKAQRKQRKATS